MYQPKTLYLLDDDTDDLDFFTEAVQSIDEAIVCLRETNSELALRRFINREVPVPDILFLDLNMPVVDGRTFLGQLRKVREYQAVPVVVYSTSSHPRDKSDMLGLGAVAFITKPYSLAELRQSLSEVLVRYLADVRVPGHFA